MNPPPAPSLREGGPAREGFGWAERVGVLLAVLSLPAAIVLWMRDIVRPGSFKRLRDVSAWPWWFWGLCALVVLFANGAGAGLGAAVMGAKDKTPEMAQQAMASIFGGLTGAGAGLMLLRLIQARTPPLPGPDACSKCGYALVGLPVDGGLQKCPECGECAPPAAAGHGAWDNTGLRATVSGRAVGQGLVGLALAFPLVQVMGLLGQWISMQVRGVQPDPIAHETLRTLEGHKSSGWAWGLALCAVFLAPMVEELLFRLYLQSALLRLFGRTWPAVLVTAVLFAAIHLGGGVKLENAHTLLALFTLGAGMGIAYERTRNVVVPIVMHMAFNGVNVGLTVWG